MSDFLHEWLTATQYVAPLMADFDTSLAQHSFIRSSDNGNMTGILPSHQHAMIIVL